MRQVVVNTKLLSTVLVVVAVALAAASFAVNFCTRHLGIEDVPFDHVLAVSHEANIPTYFSTMLLATAALLLFIIGSALRGDGPRTARPWLALAALFLYLSADEAAMLHELARNIPTDWLPDWHILHWKWQIIGVPVLVVLGFLFWPFVRGLPRATRIRFVVAGVVFVCGALGLESVGAHLTGTEAGALPIIIEETVEEFLEMLGVILFIRAMLLHIATYLPGIRLAVEASPDDDGSCPPSDDAVADA